jgi:antitoxin (DNA-binding transcriptional repressor) of toxin-antitoxin stability system
MKEISVREMRASIGRLDQLVAEAGQLVISRHGKPIARVLPMPGRRARPDHADLRARMPRLAEPSEALIRAERNER